MQYFNNADWDLFNASADKALNKVADGELVSWYNPDTGSGGSFKPLKTSTQNNLTCRNLKISDYAHRQKDSYVFIFCQYPAGWKILQK